MSVPICDRFYTKLANSDKITSFKRVPLLDAQFEGNPRTQGSKILSRKTRVFAAVHGKDSVILACTVLIQIKSVKNRQTDGQTDGGPGNGYDARSILLSRVKKSSTLHDIEATIGEAAGYLPGVQEMSDVASSLQLANFFSGTSLASCDVTR